MISVIIPVYKVEKYLDECIQSVVSQTYKDLEILIIDDGSPDSCPQKCDEWAKKDSRIKVIHKENEKLSVARNTGLKIANGEYIAFVDSDDFIHPMMFERLLDELIQNDADISMCKFNYFRDGAYGFQEVCNQKPEKEGKKTNILSHAQFVEMFADVESSVADVVWNKLYRKEVIGDSVFKPGVLIEDIRFIAEVAQKIQKVAYSNEKLYFYRNREQSIMQQKKEIMIHKANAFEDCIESLIKFENDNFNRKYISNCLNKVANYVVLLTDNREESGDLIFKLRQWYVRIYDKYHRKFRIKNMKLWLYRYFPGIYVFAKRKG